MLTHNTADNLKVFILAESNLMWHALGLLLVLLLLSIRRWANRTNIIIIFLFSWPGVVLHEFCHLIIGLLFNANPGRFNLIPERNHRHGGWTLGSVEFSRITAMNAVTIALGPCPYRHERGPIQTNPPIFRLSAVEGRQASAEKQQMVYLRQPISRHSSSGLYPE